MKYPLRKQGRNFAHDKYIHFSSRRGSIYSSSNFSPAFCEFNCPWLWPFLLQPKTGLQWRIENAWNEKRLTFRKTTNVNSVLLLSRSFFFLRNKRKVAENYISDILCYTEICISFSSYFIPYRVLDRFNNYIFYSIVLYEFFPSFSSYSVLFRVINLFSQIIRYPIKRVIFNNFNKLCIFVHRIRTPIL